MLMNLFFRFQSLSLSPVCSEYSRIQHQRKIDHPTAALSLMAGYREVGMYYVVDIGTDEMVPLIMLGHNSI